MRYIALLRGVNVGGRVIKMPELKTAFEAFGFKDVITILQTGNVVFNSNNTEDSLKLSIEAGLRKIFHYPAKAQVYRLNQLRDIVDDSPFGVKTEGYHSYVVFFESGLEKTILNDVKAIENQQETMQLGSGVIYWRVEKGKTLSSPFAGYLNRKRYKDFNTNRNINTLHKIMLQAS